MALLRPTRSLLLTGLADVWTALRQEARRPGERFGLLLMVLSAASFALMAAVAKKMLPHTPTQAVVFSRGVLMAVIFATMARIQGVPLMGRNPRLLLLRGLVGYAALSCYFYSVLRLPLGDAVLLQYSHPVFVALLAPLLLGESTGRAHWSLVLAGLAGVALIVGPSGELRGAALVGSLGAVLSGFAYIAVRKLARTEHPLTIMVWFPLATIPFSLAATVGAGRDALPRGGYEVAGHLLVTATALLGQVTLTTGLVRVAAARATAVTMSGPVFGLIYGYLLFGTVPTVASAVGTAAVITALILLARSRAPG